METLYARKKDEKYKRMTKFWGKIFLLSFAVGVVTGIIQEFQFGMNWSNYSRFMGDIFGAPLAVEALLAFFLESVFIGVWMFTWDRFKPKTHALFIWLVALGSSISALWILAANSFMQHPVAFNLANGRAELTSFADLLKNGALWVSFPHVIVGALVTAGFVVAGMSAWALLRKKEVPFFTSSLRIGLTFGLIASICTIITGDIQTQYIIKEQPMKFAATEGLYENSGDPAAWSVIQSTDSENKKVNWDISVPYVLSLLTYRSTSGSVTGMNEINTQLHKQYDGKYDKNIDYYVPPKTLYWSFRVMAVGNLFLSLLALVGLALSRKGKEIAKQRWILYVLGVALYLPFIINTAGWLITELGRYPWIVYGLLTIADAVSPTITAGQLLFSNIAFVLIFLAVGGALIFFARRALLEGPAAADTDPYGEKPNKTHDPLAKEAFKS
jgi:cytochrome d ubiquinol oxidase subunit I